MKPRVLIYGHSISLLDTRGAVVKSAGFDATNAYTHSDAVKLIEPEPVDAMILCHTVPLEETKALLIKTRTLKPDMKTLVLVVANHSVLIPQDVATLNIWKGPEALVATP